MRIVKFH